MANDLRFDGRVVVITGAGNGLGRSHALLLAGRGAKVVVNDLGGGAHGDGKSSAAADKVVDEIKAAGGEAVANYDSVEDGAKIIQTALDAWGRIDIVVNNAGILRDTTFQKMSESDWELIYRVHVLGAFRVTQAAWNHMREAGYGRIIMTSSAAGIYGNFGQANYSTAKLGLVGFMNTLAVEGKKRGVHANAIAPIAGSRLTETVMPKDLTDALKPEYVSPLVAWLCHESCTETGGLFELGGGFMSKLRFERTEGHTFRTGREITPERVRDAFGAITDFSKTTHPPDITSSMGPVMANLQAGPSKGGNDLIDCDLALGYEWPEKIESSYDERDLAIYALGVGAAHDPLDAGELSKVYELKEDFQPIPTYGVIPAINAVLKLGYEGKSAPGLRYGLDRVLHGEQYTELKRPLPRKAKLSHKAKVKAIFDKGKNAVVVTGITSYDEAGRELVYNEISTFVRGGGGFGGDRGPSADVNVAPDRAPDAVIEEKTSPSQALLYRLSGDWNPLHADPSFAKAFGFEKPILHGLCTFGFVGRHVIKAFAGGDGRKFKSIKVRFADSVFPGETLRTEMWKESDQKIIVRCTVVERNKVCVSNAAVELWKEIPVEAPPPAKAGAAAAAPAAIGSAQIFEAIGGYVAAHPELVGKTNAIFGFKLTSPDSAWTIDLKNGSGSVTSGEPSSYEALLILADSDFIAMASGQADAQKLYLGGKLKVKGNVMAAQKLGFLKEIPKSAPVAPAAAPAAAAAAAAEVSSAAIFAAIGAYVGEHPELVGKTSAIFGFKLANPDSAWTIDLKNGKGTVKPGEPEGAEAVLILDDADFIAMASGKADAQKLYLGGKLKVKGNVMAAGKLGFLKDIPKSSVAAPAPAPAAAKAAAPAPAASAAVAKAAEVFAKVKDALAKQPALAGEVGALVQVNVKSPDASWVLDLRAAPGAVREGTDAAATTTITIEDADLADWSAGKADARSLYQHGKLRVDGPLAPIHRLGFLGKIS